MFYYETRAKKRGFSIIAGVDEAGRGPLAGPVVAAAVILKDSKFTNRIDDSKRLTPLSREKAFLEIYRKAYIGLGIINEVVIDRVNILQATILAAENALASLPVRPDFVLVDGTLRLNIDLPYQAIIKGDAKSFTIACASIVAKVMRDRIMRVYHKVYPEYGFFQHKGYGTKLHRQRIKRFKPSPIHRATFSYA
jgi:ribonuclease HII